MNLKTIIYLLTLLLCATPSAFGGSGDIRVKMDTSHGTIVLALDAKSAPATVENFLSYVKSGFFDNTIFHRVIKSFMIQGGGFADFSPTPFSTA
jgi:peptidyl-prolyl cis-trans isomerase B (cyclophilin B)